jgi:hypothetical protein
VLLPFKPRHIAKIKPKGYILPRFSSVTGCWMAVEVEYTDEFGEWWGRLDESEQESVAAVVELLEDRGTQLDFPHSSGIALSRHRHMRELRIQHKGQPYRILYAFDPKRNAVLLIGGNKKGQDDWYKQYVPLADRLYDAHLAELATENQLGSTG